ncbi:hypothetical protein ABZ470_17440 [Streptosporangium sp. NPDC020072]
MRHPKRVAPQVIDDAEPEPSITTVRRGAELMRSFSRGACGRAVAR